METPEMTEAMEILKKFSEREENYHLYLSRLDERRDKQTWENEKARDKAAFERMKSSLERERANKKVALAEKKRALVEQERLRALLSKAGIDPDQGYR